MTPPPAPPGGRFASVPAALRRICHGQLTACTIFNRSSGERTGKVDSSGGLRLAAASVCTRRTLVMGVVTPGATVLAIELLEMVVMENACETRRALFPLALIPARRVIGGGCHLLMGLNRLGTTQGPRLDPSGRAVGSLR